MITGKAALWCLFSGTVDASMILLLLTLLLTFASSLHDAVAAIDVAVLCNTNSCCLPVSVLFTKCFVGFCWLVRGNGLMLSIVQSQQDQRCSQV